MTWVALLFACTGTTETPDVDVDQFQAIIEGAAWSAGVTVTVDGDAVTLTSDGLPDHDTMEKYAAITPQGEDFSYPTEQDLSFTLTLNPTAASSVSDTDLGATGLAVSGATFFNPYEATDGVYAWEDDIEVDGVPFMDDCAGHPTPESGLYHYHNPPKCTVDALDTDGQHSEFVGLMIDGFPIYGPQDTDGEEPTDLDDCNGHVGPVPDMDGEMYHYHATWSRPYVPECYMGTPSVSGRN